MHSFAELVGVGELHQEMVQQREELLTEMNLLRTELMSKLHLCMNVLVRMCLYMFCECMCVHVLGPSECCRDTPFPPLNERHRGAEFCWCPQCMNVCIAQHFMNSF